MLLLHGADDPLCLPAGSERFFASLPADEIPGSELRIYPGLRHEIFNEPEQASVFDDLHGWLTKLEAGR
jgi:alpha-beta hydrolase superfamily lysophospholipase